VQLYVRKFSLAMYLHRRRGSGRAGFCNTNYQMESERMGVVCFLVKGHCVIRGEGGALRVSPSEIYTTQFRWVVQGLHVIITLIK